MTDARSGIRHMSDWSSLRFVNSRAARSVKSRERTPWPNFVGIRQSPKTHKFCISSETILQFPCSVWTLHHTVTQSYVFPKIGPLGDSFLGQIFCMLHFVASFESKSEFDGTSSIFHQQKCGTLYVHSRLNDWNFYRFLSRLSMPSRLKLGIGQSKLTHYRPAMPFDNRKIYSERIFSVQYGQNLKNILPLET